MLDDSAQNSHTGQRQVSAEELAWVARELTGGPTVVVGSGDLPREYAEGQLNAREVVQTLEAGKASAYFFDAPEQNVQETLTGSPGSIPAYGSGTLGYVNVLAEENGGFIGQSGFLVAEVGSKLESGRYPVKVKLVPNIAELAVEAQQGTLLRRSQAATFAGLARRPRSGNRAHNQATEQETAPYVDIPSNCLGAGCARGIEPFYEFTTSDPTRGVFVERNIHSPENPVLHNAAGKPIVQPGGHDGLLCALNATQPNHPLIVTLKAGNLSYSLPVTIQAGSVRQPCGTTPLKDLPAKGGATVEPPPAPAEGGPSPASSPPVAVPVPPVPVAAVHAPAPTHAHPAPSFFVQPAPVAFLPAFVPVPVPTPARPTPPSGTSAVTSPVEAAQEEEEEEAAPESVSNEAVAYRPEEHEPSPFYLLGVVVLAAFAGASIRRRRPRRGRRGVAIAPATVATQRAQRRMERELRDWPPRQRGWRR